MAKLNTTTADRPKALDTLVNMVDLAASHRFVDRTPTLSDLARLTATASRCLRYNDVDERISVENAAVMALAKRRQLVS